MSYKEYIYSLFDYGIILHADVSNLSESIETYGAHYLEEIISDDAPIILTNMHFSLFHLSFFSKVMKECEIYVVRPMDSDTRKYIFHEKISSHCGIKVKTILFNHKNNIQAATKIMKALNKNKKIAFILDGGISNVKRDKVNFLGDHILMPTGFIDLGIKANASIVPTILIRDQSNKYMYNFYICKPIKTQSFSNKKNPTNAIANMLYSHYFNFIERYPNTWTSWDNMEKFKVEVERQ